MDDIQTVCPICLQPVIRVIEIDQEVIRKNIVCENEYYIHWANSLYKITEPKTLFQ